MRAAWMCLGGCVASVLTLLPACRESMHPDPERETPAEETSAQPEATASSKPEPKAAPTPAPALESAKPAEEKPAATGEKPAGSADKERTSDGYEVVRAKGPDGTGADVAIKAPPGFQVVTGAPDTKDPHEGKFTLEEAVKGLPAKGKLHASIRTSMGTFQCQLFDDKAPKTVANFVGLARGLRKFWSPKDKAWVGRPYFDGTTFHRVIPEFMIQGGDWKGDGTGDMYFTIPDELDPSLKHDRGGLMCMANRGPNTNEAQFFITEQAAEHLDTSYTIFGECAPLDLVKRIARVPQGHNNKPLTPVVIEKVTIDRRATGAAAKPAAATPAAQPTATKTE